MNCEYCGTKLFETDRECPKCGGTIIPIKISDNSTGVSKKIIVSVGDVYCYYNKRIIFIGKTLLDSSIEVFDGKSNLIYYLSSPITLNVSDWEIKDTIGDEIFYIKVLTTVIYQYKNGENEIKKLEINIPKSKVFKKGNILVCSSLKYLENGIDVSGYLSII